MAIRVPSFPAWPGLGKRGVGIAHAAWSLMLGADMKEVNELRGLAIRTGKVIHPICGGGRDGAAFSELFEGVTQRLL